jgi:hypothetical protein
MCVFEIKIIFINNLGICILCVYDFVNVISADSINNQSRPEL